MAVPDGAISVVIPCYNARRWIGATLRSVLAQELPPAEVVVVDDGSRDGSAEQVERDFPQVRVVRQANAGVAAARNRGVREARGDWVAFIDADDIWRPAKLRRQCEALRAEPAAELCYSAWEVWPSETPEPPPELLRAAPAAQPGPRGWVYCDLLLDCAVWTSTTLMRRSLFTDLGGFDESLRVGEDYDLWLRASRRTRVVRVDEALALYRQHPTSLTRHVPTTNWQALVIGRALERWGVQGPDGRSADAGAVSASLARSWKNHAHAHLVAGNGRTAAAACAQALRLHWRDLGTWKLALRSSLAAARPGAALAKKDPA